MSGFCSAHKTFKEGCIQCAATPSTSGETIITDNEIMDIHPMMPLDQGIMGILQQRGFPIFGYVHYTMDTENYIYERMSDPITGNNHYKWRRK
jgi:hypothetical protein